MLGHAREVIAMLGGRDLAVRRADRMPRSPSTAGHGAADPKNRCEIVEILRRHAGG